MKEPLFMVFAFIAGLFLGMLYFLGLWLTVKKAVTASIPAIWFSGSFLLRTGILLAGFYYISHGSPQSLLLCTIGFVAGRYIFRRFIMNGEELRFQIKKEVANES